MNFRQLTDTHYQGNHVRLARTLNLSRQTTYNWYKSEAPVPVDRILDICSDLDWIVTPHQLGPDFYPNQHDGIPPSKLLHGKQGSGA